MMKELTISASKRVYLDWCNSNTFPKIGEFNCPEETPTELKEVRNELLLKYQTLKNEGYSDYELDCRLSVWFYNYVKMQSWMNMRVATTEDFWRYFAMVVVPDIITDRFAKSDKPDARHYYSKGTRIYPYTLYWYACLSWSKDEEATLKLLTQKGFNTDTIVGLVERTGRNGTPIELYRNIVHNFSEFAKTKSINHFTFRSIMKLCLAKITVVDPDLFEGGNKMYAFSLVSECSKKAPLRE